MVSINFDRLRGEYLMRCILNGKALPPSNPTSGWTTDDCLCVAGVCLFTALGYGPVMHPGVKLENLSKERREAIEAAHCNDLQIAIEFHRMLFRQILDRQYDEQFEDLVVAGITESEGTVSLVPVKGFKNFSMDEAT